EIENHAIAPLQLGRYRARQFYQHREEQHTDRRRQPKQGIADDPEQIERDGGEACSRDRAGSDRPAGIFLIAFLSDIFASRLEVGLSLLGWLQTPLAGELWISLAHQIERAGEQYCHQAAEHHGWQDFGKHLALRDT